MGVIATPYFLIFPFSFFTLFTLIFSLIMTGNSSKTGK